MAAGRLQRGSGAEVTWSLARPGAGDGADADAEAERLPPRVTVGAAPGPYGRCLRCRGARGSVGAPVTAEAGGVQRLSCPSGRAWQGVGPAAGLRLQRAVPR